MIDLLSIDQLGEVSLFPTARDFAKTCGSFLHAYQQAALAAFCNRFTPDARYPSNGQEPAAALHEFSLPQDQRLLADKWQHSRDRFTKIGLANMLKAVGFQNWSIYNFRGRIDSVDFGIGTSTAFPGGSPASLPSLLTKYNVHTPAREWWTLCVYLGGFFYPYDVQRLDVVPFVVGRSGLLTRMGSSDVPNGTTPQWSIYPSPLQIIEQICRYQTSQNECCFEVVFCFSSHNDDRSSGFDADLVPLTTDDVIAISPVEYQLGH